MFKDIVFEGTCLGCIMKWGENESSAWALQSLPPRLVSNLENYVKHSDKSKIMEWIKKGFSKYPL